MRMEMAEVTRRHGRWWYPNNLVQQTRYLTYLTEKATKRWPGLFATPVRFFMSLPKLLLERIFYGLYRN